MLTVSSLSARVYNYHYSARWYNLQIIWNNAFHIDCEGTEMTQGQLKNVMVNNPLHFRHCSNESPVERIFWNDLYPLDL